jgi:hypothetical protein
LPDDLTTADDGQPRCLEPAIGLHRGSMPISPGDSTREVPQAVVACRTGR